MTIMQSCDHHDVGGCVPDNRSRRRMLAQLQAATELGEAIGRLVVDADQPMICSFDLRDGAPTVTLGLRAFMEMWDYYKQWREAAPRGDDWAPPIDPPSEIRVPDIDTPTEDAALPSEGQAPR
jgi:hypothetical protein